jgi:hypothetical protein
MHKALSSIPSITKKKKKRKGRKGRKGGAGGESKEGRGEGKERGRKDVSQSEGLGHGHT